MKRNTVIAILLVVIVVGTVGAYWYYSQSATTSTEEFKIAVMFQYSARDGSWGQWMYDDLMKIDAEFDDITVTIVEQVGITDVERIAGDYAEDGYDLILGHTDEYKDGLLAAAASYPNTYFMNYGAYEYADNFAGYQVSGFEAEYLAGILGAGISKTGKIAYQGTFGYPYEYAGFHALELGAHVINESINVVPSWTGTWTDVAKGYETTLALIESGFDYVATSASGPALGAIQAAGEYDDVYIPAMFSAETFDVDPDVVICCVVFRGYNLVMDAVNNVRQGTFEGKTYEYYMAEGGIDFVLNQKLLDKIPAEILDKMDEAEQDIIDGVLEIPYMPFE